MWHVVPVVNSPMLLKVKFLGSVSVGVHGWEEGASNQRIREPTLTNILQETVVSNEGS